MKTTLRNNFHSMSITCKFDNNATLSLKLGYQGFGGSGKGVTQSAFDRVMNVSQKAWESTVGKRFENNGLFMAALNEAIQGAADPITVADKIEDFIAA